MFTKEEKKADFIKAVEICCGYDPYAVYSDYQEMQIRRRNAELDSEFDNIMSKYGVPSMGVPITCTRMDCRGEEETVQALRAWVLSQK